AGRLTEDRRKAARPLGQCGFPAWPVPEPRIKIAARRGSEKLPGRRTGRPEGRPEGRQTARHARPPPARISSNRGSFMRLRNQQDFWAGVMFTLIGVLFAFFSTSYEVGTAARMGPGYFPLVLGILLAVLGLIIGWRSFA